MTLVCGVSLLCSYWNFTTIYVFLTCRFLKERIEAVDQDPEVIILVLSSVLLDKSSFTVDDTSSINQRRSAGFTVGVFLYLGLSAAHE